MKPATLLPKTVTGVDQFGSQTVTLRYPHRLCAPADKNGEGISDEVQHLTGYEILKSPFTRRTNETFVNQFGTITIELTRRDVVMVPSSKSLVGVPPPLVEPIINHYQCYRAKRARGAARFPVTTVHVEDQFEAVDINLTRPYRLCVPLNKNDEDPAASTDPNLLLCYRSKSRVRFGTLDARVGNQILADDDVRLIHRRELCVPTRRP